MPTNFRGFGRLVIVFRTCPLFGKQKNGRPKVGMSLLVFGLVFLFQTDIFRYVLALAIIIGFAFSVAAVTAGNWWLTLWLNDGGALINNSCSTPNVSLLVDEEELPGTESSDRKKFKKFNRS